MVKENKCYTCAMKKHFIKELAMTKKDDENFESSINCWIRGNIFA